jgi:fermentation-respiration switch protein FrsA (DUF1100 family)
MLASDTIFHIICRKLFELLVLSGALAELTWPAILNKRPIFRYFFAIFDITGGLYFWRMTVLLIIFTYASQGSFHGF